MTFYPNLVDKLNASFLNQRSPKLLQVLDWLVLEKHDSDRSKMTEERINLFFDYVLNHQDLCAVNKVKNKIPCKELRQAVDNNGDKDKAGTGGIDFNTKIKGSRKKRKTFVSPHDINAVEPYGVLLILDLAVEFGCQIHNRVRPREVFPKPKSLNTLVKFIINN